MILAACTVDAAQSMWSSAWYRGLGGRYMFSLVECSELDGIFAPSGIRIWVMHVTHPRGGI